MNTEERERVYLDAILGVEPKDSVATYTEEMKKAYEETLVWIATLPPGATIDVPFSGSDGWVDIKYEGKNDLTTQQG